MPQGTNLLLQNHQPGGGIALGDRGFKEEKKKEGKKVLLLVLRHEISPLNFPLLYLGG